MRGIQIHSSRALATLLGVALMSALFSACAVGCSKQETPQSTANSTYYSGHMAADDVSAARAAKGTGAAGRSLATGKQ